MSINELGIFMAKIFIFEFFSGGGLSDREISNSLLGEGFAMLSAAIEEFSHLPEVEIMTTIDYRIFEFKHLLKAKWVIRIDARDSFISILESIINPTFDGFLIIAPETGGILYNLTKMLEEKGVRNLGCRADAVQITTNKFKTLKLVELFGVTIPQTIAISTENPPEKIYSKARDLGTPFVIKPLDGVSGAGLKLVNDLEDLKKGLQTIREESPEPWLLAQEYVKGINVSSSFIVRKEKIYPLTLNFQDINLEEPDTEYQGGYVPFEHEMKEEIMALSIKLLKRIPGLQNYVGIDYVIGENAIYFMEINPRLTTSFIGISKVATFDMSKFIFHKNFTELEAIPLDFYGTAYFSKVKLKIPTWEITHLYLMSQNQPEVIAPPFQIEDSNENNAIALIVTTGMDLHDAKKRFYEIKNDLVSFFHIS